MRNTFTFPHNPMASGKGKTPIADAYEQVQTALSAYQGLLVAALGDDAETYELACASVAMGRENVGIAFSVKDHRVYVLVTDDGRPDMHYLPTWLLDLAKYLTEALRTFVVPDQGSEFTYWSDSERGRFIAYKFKMADSPTSIVPAGTAPKESGKTMQKYDLHAKRRQLSAIENAVVSLNYGRMSPCAAAAIVSGGAAALVAGPVFQLGLTVAFGTGAATVVLAYVFSKFPKSWAEVVDKRLENYEPVDHEAYAKLHERTKAYGGLELRAMFEWLDSENAAVQMCKPVRLDGSGKRFMSKDVSGNREPHE
ncbi:hypothetical protein KW849_14460 [Pseudomonas sp. PDM26]|uniref:hypothetical protein n=1 Tax=Pseudomonas TaxID=286 RepID=UPI001C4610F1|nr:MULTISPECIES: hypothetical protein [Pseudomonas]MBV7547491.1 hypothetical protein [Pseudomonas sp. PDM26]MCT9825968.1 hypothetical protein [Pseudomonas veronii]